MRDLAERAYFRQCRALGRLLRAARYATTRIVEQDGKLGVRKRRRVYAPLLVWMGGPLVAVLDTGVRVLPQREWEERERLAYRRLHGAPVRIGERGTLVLPHLPGRTLAELLEDRSLDAPVRQRSIELAAAALADLHRTGFTHGDAMAENVMIDLAGGAARWFDFETLHDADRPSDWRRADDVRALLATCLVRTASGSYGDVLRAVLDASADDGVTRLLAASFGSVLRRPLTFHLGQAALSFRQYGEVARLLDARLGA